MGGALMIREYSGSLGTFSYDDTEFTISHAGNYLEYVGNGENVRLPKGCISIACMFSHWEGEVLDLTNFDTSAVEHFDEAFSGCPNLVEIIGIETLNVSSGKTFPLCFCGTRKLTHLDLHLWDMHNAIDVAAMFWDCSGLVDLDVSGWNLSKCEDISMFTNGCQSLKVLRVDNWNIENVTKATKFACSCSELERLSLDTWNHKTLANVDGMLANCPKLQHPDLTSWCLSDYAISRMYTNTSDSEEMTIF